MCLSVSGRRHGVQKRGLEGREAVGQPRGVDALRVADPRGPVAGREVVGVEVDLQLGEADLEGAALAQLRVAGSTLWGKGGRGQFHGLRWQNKKK